MDAEYNGSDRRVRKRGSVGRRYSDRKWPRHARDFWLFVVTVIVLFALKSGQDTNGTVARNQRSNTQALCSFRNDLQTRVNSSNDFLQKHPLGIPGVPVAAIRTSIANEQSTLNALKPLICPNT